MLASVALDFIVLCKLKPAAEQQPPTATVAGQVVSGVPVTKGTEMSSL